MVFSRNFKKYNFERSYRLTVRDRLYKGFILLVGYSVLMLFALRELGKTENKYEHAFIWLNLIILGTIIFILLIYQYICLWCLSNTHRKTQVFKI